MDFGLISSLTHSDFSFFQFLYLKLFSITFFLIQFIAAKAEVMYITGLLLKTWHRSASVISVFYLCDDDSTSLTTASQYACNIFNAQGNHSTLVWEDFTQQSVKPAVKPASILLKEQLNQLKELNYF